VPPFYVVETELVVESGGEQRQLAGQLSLLQNALLAQPPRYAKNFYPHNIKYMPAVKFFHALILNENHHFARGSTE